MSVVLSVTPLFCCRECCIGPLVAPCCIEAINAFAERVQSALGAAGCNTVLGLLRSCRSRQQFHRTCRPAAGPASTTAGAGLQIHSHPCHLRRGARSCAKSPKSNPCYFCDMRKSTTVTYSVRARSPRSVLLALYVKLLFARVCKMLVYVNACSC